MCAGEENIHASMDSMVQTVECTENIAGKPTELGYEQYKTMVKNLMHMHLKVSKGLSYFSKSWLQALNILGNVIIAEIATARWIFTIK